MLSFKDFNKVVYEERFDASHRDKLAKAKRGKSLSSATKDKISDTMKGTSNFAGKKHTKADKVKIQLSRGHDDRVDGRKWMVKKGDGNTYRKYSLPNRYDYQYGRRVRRNVNENHLHIFDIDDTLFHTTAKVAVLKNGKIVRELTNQEFNNYKLKPGEEFDYRQFRSAKKFKEESMPIKRMMAKAKIILSRASKKPNSKVIIVTARDDFDDKNTFLDTFREHGFDIDKVRVERAGKIRGDMLPAFKKVIIIRNYLNTGQFERVRLFDDSMTNLKEFLKLRKEFPEINFEAYFANPDGSVKTINESAYAGNIGFMELVKFHKKASQEQKKMLQSHIQNKKHKEFRDLIKQVTGVELHKTVNEKQEFVSKAGAGEWGRPELTRNYIKGTPGQNVKRFKKYISNI